MNILVCINQVPDTTSKINLTADTSVFDPTGVVFIVNPSDESALTRAIQLKEKIGASITIIHVGKADSEPTMRKAFATGADKMIRIDVEPTDGFVVANEIAQILKKESFDLILCGKESLDYHGGMVGGLLATLANIHFVDDVTSIEIENNQACVERETDGGKSILSVPLPLLVAVQKELIADNELRIPNIRNIMAARQAPIEVVSAINESAQIQTLHLEKPTPKDAIKMIDANNLDELIDELHNVKKLF